MIKVEKWVSKMDLYEYIAFLEDLYGKSNDTWNIARRLLKTKGTYGRNFSKSHLDRWDPWDGNDIDERKDPKQKMKIFIYLSTKHSRYRNLKIDYLRRFGFECEGA